MRPTNEAPPVLFVDRVQSLNYDGPDGLEVFADAGTRLDLETGDIISTGLAVDGTTGDVAVRGDITATSMVATVRGGTLQYAGDNYGFELVADVWTDPDTTASLELIPTQNAVLVGAFPDETIVYFDGAAAYLRAEALGHVATLDLQANDVSFGDRVALSIDDGLGNVASVTGTVLSGAPRIDVDAGAKITVTDDVQLFRDGAERFHVRAGGRVEDGDGRQFIRSDTGRTDNIMLQAGEEGTPFVAVSAVASSVTFIEEFSSGPIVVATVKVPSASGANNQMQCIVYDVTVAGFSYKIVNGNGANLTATFTLQWMAYADRSI